MPRKPSARQSRLAYAAHMGIATYACFFAHFFYHDRFCVKFGFDKDGC